MKEVLAKDLKVGDVFIDGDVYGVVHPKSRATIIDGEQYVIVKCIVGPSVHSFIESAREYYLPYNYFVLLCEKE